MELYDSSFIDSGNRTWKIELKVSTVFRFCGKENVRFAEILPGQLNDFQLMSLAFDGLQHMAYMDKFLEKGGEDAFELWCDEVLTGEVFGKSMEAANLALINFTLSQTNPKQASVIKAKFDHALNIERKKVKTEEKKLMKKTVGQKKT